MTNDAPWYGRLRLLLIPLAGAFGGAVIMLIAPAFRPHQGLMATSTLASVHLDGGMDAGFAAGSMP